ncbi:hypothetical protein HOG21_06880 [bacterium]|jgi:hypothetical protein|nr:hypothetical protein [bacterium]
MENEIKELIKEFFDKLPIQIDLLEIKIDDETKNIINLKIKTEESGIII